MKKNLKPVPAKNKGLAKLPQMCVTKWVTWKMVVLLEEQLEVAEQLLKA